MNEEYRIETKIKNNLLYQAVTDGGKISVSAFCKKHNMSAQWLGNLLSMKMSPFKSSTSGVVVLRSIVQQILDITGKEFNDLFTEKQAKANVSKSVNVILVAESEIIRLSDLSSHDINLLESPKESDEINLSLDKEELERIMQNTNLSDRHRKVIDLLFFQGNTLEDAAKTLGVSRERVRQMEVKALRLFRRTAWKFEQQDKLTTAISEGVINYKEKAPVLANAALQAR